MDAAGSLGLQREKAAPVPTRCEAQMGCGGLANVGKSVATTDRAAGKAGAEGDNWYMFACVVGAAEGRVVAVVGGDDDEIAGLQLRFELR